MRSCAVIRGSAINNDGRLKVGYTAPSVAGEARVIAEAQAVGGVEPETVTMVEAHGAGTFLGDPIEVAALVDAFGDCAGARQILRLGSVKSNIGHVDAAAGIAGFIKAVLAVQHREIPPTLHYQTANPQIDFRKTPFYVNDRLRTVGPDQRPFRAGVSSFGIGGTNAHVVLEEPPATGRDHAPAPPSRSYDLLLLSARTGSALEQATDRLADHLERTGELSLGDVCFTLRSGRRSFEHRRALVCRDREEAVAAPARSRRAP